MKRLQRLSSASYAPAASTRGRQAGFIPMILTIIFILAAVIYLAFRRVIQVQHQ